MSDYSPQPLPEPTSRALHRTTLEAEDMVYAAALGLELPVYLPVPETDGFLIENLAMIEPVLEGRVAATRDVYALHEAGLLTEAELVQYLNTTNDSLHKPE